MRFLFFQTAPLRKLVWLVAMLIIPLAGYADDARDKVVTLQLDGVTLKQFFDEIRTQTNVDFIYTQQQARSVEPITIHVTGETLGKVLDRVFAGTRIEYTIKGQIVTLRYRQNVEISVSSSQSKEE